MAQMDALVLEAAEEVFGHGVVIGIALAGHALPDAEAGETLTVSVGGVLDAAVGVEDEAGQRLAAALGVFVLWLTFFITPFHYTDCFSVRQIGYGGINDIK